MRRLSGFTLVEVLIATLILAAAALTVQAAYGQYVKLRDRITRAEARYAAALSIRDAIATAQSPPAPSREGEWSGLPYRYEARAIGTRQRRIGSPAAVTTGRSKLHVGRLYEIELSLDGRNYAFAVLHTESRDVR
jgi:prepilin-type N-terminal cleavage/methylation domain-containing protein